jgi:hypothetical protein
MGMIGNLYRVTKEQLDQYLKGSSVLEDDLYTDDSENPNLTDLDKAWDGIIFVLTGDNMENSIDHPLTKVLFSGQIINEEEDMGYGPAHYLTPEQVADLNNQVSVITIADLKMNYDPVRMLALDVYPEIWEEGDGAFDYIAENFNTLKNVFSEATKNGEAIITFIN